MLTPEVSALVIAQEIGKCHTPYFAQELHPENCEAYLEQQAEEIMRNFQADRSLQQRVLQVFLQTRQAMSRRLVIDAYGYLASVELRFGFRNGHFRSPAEVATVLHDYPLYVPVDEAIERVGRFMRPQWKKEFGERIGVIRL